MFHLDDFYKYGIAIVLLVIGFFHIEVFLCLGIYIYIIRRQVNVMCLAILISLITISYTIVLDFDQETVHDQFMIVDIDHYDSYLRYTVKQKRYKFHLYDYENTYQIGDIIYIKGSVVEYKKQSASFGFDAYTYYLSFHVYGKIDVHEIQYIKHQFHINEYREKLMQKTDDLESNAYLKAFLFGEKINNEDIKNNYENFDILYLFTVSGMHIYVLVLGLRKLLFMLNVDDRFQNGSIGILLLIIAYMNAFAFAVLRVAIVYFLKLLNKKYNLYMQPLDMIFMTFYIILLLHIGYIFHIGFMMTFVILIGLELMHPIYQRYKGFNKRLVMSFIIALLIIPFYGHFSIFQVILLPGILFIISFILYPLSICALILPNFNIVFDKAIYLFEMGIEKISIYQNSFHLPKMNIYLSIVYYSLLIWICFSSHIKIVFRRVILSVGFLSIFFTFHLQKYQETITFLDVGQGDTTIINSHSCHMVIDSYQGTLSYLKNHGVYKLDYLILTHSHEDHIKEANSIINDIDVNQIILSKYDNHYPSYKQKALRVKAFDQFTCGDIKIRILGPLKAYEDDNNNSIVLTFDFDKKSFLFTGDIEKDAEMDLIEKYGAELKSDIIKVAHHGSYTSSSSLFIDYVNPSHAIISLKTPNTYGFPSDDVIKTYIKKNVIIYRTDHQGSITYHAKRRKEKWDVYLSI